MADDDLSADDALLCSDSEHADHPPHVCLDGVRYTPEEFKRLVADVPGLLEKVKRVFRAFD